MSRTVSVFGMGYLGLVMSVVLAEKSPVIGVESDEDKVRRLSQGSLTIFEPEVEKWLTLYGKNLKFTVSLRTAVEETDLIFVTVNTPNLEDGSQDLSAMTEAIKGIGLLLRNGENKLIVIRSTVLPKTTESVIIPLLEEVSALEAGEDFHICVNPEFLAEGSAIENMLNPDKIVIGSNDQYATESLKEFYNKFYKGKEIPIICTNFVNAEMIKHAQNAFLSTKISFINTIANICEKTPDADVEVVAKAIGLDKRIAPSFLKAGLGFGGGCLPKDLNCFRKYAQRNDYDPILLDAVSSVNETQPLHAIQIAEDQLGNLKGRRFAILGLSFKPDTDDIRGAASLKIIETLLQKGAIIHVYDPKAMEKVKQVFSDRITYTRSVPECLQSTDCCIIVTEWKEFEDIPEKIFKQLMKHPLIIDGRRALNKNGFQTTDFHAIGLAPSKSQEKRGKSN